MKHKPEDSIRIYAAGLLLQQLDALSAEIEGVKAARDIEYVHRMRVASRRMRAIMEVFPDCLPSKRGNIWLQGVKTVTGALGNARDTDVQIDSLNSILAELPDQAMRPGIRRLMLRMKQRRSKLQVKVLKKIEEFEVSGIHEEMRAAFTPLTAKTSEVYIYTPALYGRSFDKIQSSFQNFASFEKLIQDPQNVSELHAMRIAGKKFRYILECFSSLYSSALKTPISTMKTAQDLLGNIHDCDMWSIELPKFLEEEHKRTVAYFGKDRYGESFNIGIQFLIDLKKKIRDNEYTVFIQQWGQWKSDGIWENLIQTIQIPFLQEKELTPLPVIQKSQPGGAE